MPPVDLIPTILEGARYATFSDSFHDQMQRIQRSLDRRGSQVSLYSSLLTLAGCDVAVVFGGTPQPLPLAIADQHLLIALVKTDSYSFCIPPPRPRSSRDLTSRSEVLNSFLDKFMPFSGDVVKFREESLVSFLIPEGFSSFAELSLGLRNRFRSQGEKEARVSHRELDFASGIVALEFPLWFLGSRLVLEGEAWLEDHSREAVRWIGEYLDEFGGIPRGR